MSFIFLKKIFTKSVIFSRPNERGNILFLILIAVALFAALSYAVTQSQRGAGKDASAEKVSVRVARMLQYTTLVRATVQRMVIMGVAPADLNFWWDSGLPSAVFSKAGGGIILDKPGLTSNEYFLGDAYSFLSVTDNISVKNIGTSQSDVIIATYFKINSEGEKMCNSINKALGIDTIPGSSSGPEWNNVADRIPVGCARNYNDFYIFYTVLVER